MTTGLHLALALTSVVAAGLAQLGAPVPVTANAYQTSPFALVQPITTARGLDGAACRLDIVRRRDTADTLRVTTCRRSGRLEITPDLPL